MAEKFEDGRGSGGPLRPLLWIRYFHSKWLTLEIRGRQFYSGHVKCATEQRGEKQRKTEQDLGRGSAELFRVPSAYLGTFLPAGLLRRIR